MTLALETTGLGKSYGAVTALSALDLAIPKGLVYGVLGPNGAGKSTLLRMVLGLVGPSRGGFRLLARWKRAIPVESRNPARDIDGVATLRTSICTL